MTLIPTPSLIPTSTPGLIQTPFGPFDWIAMGAIFTLLAVLAALVIAIWGPQLQALFSKPELKVTIEMRPPDCIRIDTVLGTRVTEEGREFPVSWADTYYYRLRIINAGNREAQDVEVRLLKLQIVPNHTAEIDPDFLPLNLKWANTDLLPHADQVTMSRIQPKLDKHCSLCRMQNIDEDNPMVEFITEVTPNQLGNGAWPTKKKPGSYLLDIAVSANNAKVVYKTVRISFTGWFDDDAEMLSKGLVIKIID